MPKIQVLPIEVSAKIAAGEVIERPGFAVKELVENALDANATVITITLEQVGLKKIVVTDNGWGMDEEDVKLAFLPHATSKIFGIDDLHRITTLGFRGEALASIAAIATVNIASRIVDAVGGYQVQVEEGKLRCHGPIGMPVGTMVTVDNLFGNIPARKNFLKSSRTELRFIIDVVTSYALANPQVDFKLIHNKKVLIDFSSDIDHITRVKKALGFFDTIVPIDPIDGYIQVNGIITTPQHAATFAKQYLFVNNRAIVDKAISQTVKLAYGSMIEPYANPPFVLFLTVPIEAVDVNVHPRKEQISFLNKTVILDQIQSTIEHTLATHNLSYSKLTDVLAPSYRRGLTESYAANQIRDTVVPWQVRDTIAIQLARPIQQLHNLYLVVPTNHGFYIVDQHAAHERILYEQYKNAFDKKQKNGQAHVLEKPVEIKVSIEQCLILEEYQPMLQQMGFLINAMVEKCNATKFQIISIPELFKDRNPKIMLADMLANLIKENGWQPIDNKSHLMLAYLACRGAIMAGQKLTQVQTKKLVEKLESIPNSATCPHGRPTKVAVSLDELARLFKRK